MTTPFLTAELPGTGGVLRTRIEDFQVDELPLYRPSGEGEHLYLHVRKRGIPTFEAVRRIAHAFDVHERAVGYAGLKDARAITSQWLSVSGADPRRLDELSLPNIEIREARPHGNKLKIGHLRGNRFALTVRDAEPGATERARAILDILVRRGVPNRFGEQRFGARGQTHLCGEALLRRDYEAFARFLIGGGPGRERDEHAAAARSLFDEGRWQEAFDVMPGRLRPEKKCLHALIRFDGDYETAAHAVPKRMRQIYVSAYQSWLFNRVLDRRFDEIDRVQKGDLAFLHFSTGIFTVEDAAVEQRRCVAFEISPSGPLFGVKCPLARGAPGAIEEEVLAESGLQRSDFRAGTGLRFDGHRRPLRAPLRDVVLHTVDARSYRAEFSLPPGAFATTVMRELMK